MPLKARPPKQKPLDSKKNYLLNFNQHIRNTKSKCSSKINQNKWIHSGKEDAAKSWNNSTQAMKKQRAFISRTQCNTDGNFVKDNLYFCIICLLQKAKKMWEQSSLTHKGLLYHQLKSKRRISLICEIHVAATAMKNVNSHDRCISCTSL